MRISHPHANLMLERSQAGLAIELGRSAHGAAILPVERGVLSLLYHILPACRLCGILWWRSYAVATGLARSAGFPARPDGRLR